MTINDTQRYAIIIEGVETISRSLVKCEILERLYLHEVLEATDQLKRCLVDTYVFILSFLAKAKRFYQKNTASESR